jgi:hypothetical protein
MSRFAQLAVQGRVDRSLPGYDPAAEQVLLNLLQGPPAGGERSGHDVH